MRRKIGKKETMNQEPAQESSREHVRDLSPSEIEVPSSEEARVVGCISMGAYQLRKYNMDFPIWYARRQLISIEKNYTTTEREGLGMVYAVKEIRHYLLANKFVFYTDHEDLLHLANNPCTTEHVV